MSFDSQVQVEELQGYSDYLAMQEYQRYQERQEMEVEFNEWFDAHMALTLDDIENILSNIE